MKAWIIAATAAIVAGVAVFLITELGIRPVVPVPPQTSTPPTPHKPTAQTTVPPTPPVLKTQTPRPAPTELNQPSEPSTPPRPTDPTAWTAIDRSYPIDEQWPCPRGSRCFVMVRLLNIETDAHHRWLRFNFVAEQGHLTSHSPWRWVDIYLDNQGQTAFLVDERGRQHLLAAATGLSAETPTRIQHQGSSRFALLFQLVPAMQSFRYEMVLYYRWGPRSEQVDRLQIRGREPVTLADFK